MTLELVEGWTDRIIYTLKADGVAQAMAGMTVELLVYDSKKRRVMMTGTAGILDAVAGEVYFDPASTDIIVGSYSVRWKLTDGTGKVVLFPNASPATWLVRKP